MEFRVRFYQSEAGTKPLLEFINELERQNQDLHELVTQGLKRLQSRRNHGPPFTERIRDSAGLFEMRVGRSNIARVFFFFGAGQEIICTSGYVKKSMKLDTGELERASRYKADWERRAT